MKDILKMIRFDFLTAKPVALPVFLFIAGLCLLLGFFISPMIISYITFGVMIFVIPLQSVADKSGFHKLYGILPVKRRNITRARFIYIFLLFFITFIFDIVLAFTAMKLKLIRFVPFKNETLKVFAGNSFEDSKTQLLVMCGVFIGFCFIFSYMEMMGQIFGRDKEMRIILITLGAAVALYAGFMWLSENEIIPLIEIPDILGWSMPQIYMISAVSSVVMFALSVLFGEITASVLSRREL